MGDFILGNVPGAEVNVANNLTTTSSGYVLDARQGKALNDAKINASDIAIIIDGNQTTHTGGVAIGEFVLVRNSTISGITDGLYTAAKAIPANTAIDSTYLTAVDGGGLNELNGNLTSLSDHIETQTISNFFTPDTTKCTLLSAVCYKTGNVYEVIISIVAKTASGNFGTISDDVKPASMVWITGSNITDEKCQGIFGLDASLTVYGATANKVFNLCFVHIK